MRKLLPRPSIVSPAMLVAGPGFHEHLGCQRASAAGKKGVWVAEQWGCLG